jgi:hypothetical protein
LAKSRFCDCYFDLKDILSEKLKELWYCKEADSFDKSIIGLDNCEEEPLWKDFSFCIFCKSRELSVGTSLLW